MAFSEHELAVIDKAVGSLCRRRTRPELEAELSYEYSVKAHDVTMVERRPRWNGKPGHTETPVAKLKFNRSTGRWRLLWQRQDLKWHAYEAQSSSGRLSELVAEIDHDPYGCFFG